MEIGIPKTQVIVIGIEFTNYNKKSNGKYYVAIEEWRDGEVNGTEDVFVKL